MQDDTERFYREKTRVRRLRWIGIGIEFILVGVGCIIAVVFVARVESVGIYTA